MKIRCGFEWHIQINSGKLFCRCNSMMHEEPVCDLEVTRLLHPSFGEGGKVDKSASFEGEAMKKTIYKVFSDSDCLVDLDEEPPHAPDKNALETAFIMAGALNAVLFKDIVFMRKIIVDGSNTSGFQRTAIIGLNGKFTVGKKEIGISSISLEEDSARKEKEDRNTVTYKLDRLGVPLVEIATDIIETDENNAKEIALAFGKFTRLFNVRRGIGTIRQDVNLSIDGGSRVELKGFQNIREMDKAIINEARRQLALIELQKTKRYLVENLEGASAVVISEKLKNSSSNLIKNALAKGKEIIGLRLRGFDGVLGTELIPGKRFGTEISDYLKIKDSSGIVHSDELPAYGITKEEKDELSYSLGCVNGDAFLFSICENGTSGKVGADIISRIKELLISVPAEVRVVEEDNTNSFLRPLGGKDRMYVETDLPIISVEKHILDRALEYAGFSVDSLVEKYGITEEFLDLLIGAKKLNLAIKLRSKFNAAPKTLITVLVDDFRYTKRHFDLELSDEDLEAVVAEISQGKIAKDASQFIFKNIAIGKGKNAEDVIKKFDLQKKDKKTLEAEIKRLVSSGKFDRYDTLVTNLRDKFGFSFDASEAYEIASKLLKNG